MNHKEEKSLSVDGPFYCKCQFCGRLYWFDDKPEEPVRCPACEWNFARMKHSPKKPLYEYYCEEKK